MVPVFLLSYRLSVSVNWPGWMEERAGVGEAASAVGRRWSSCGWAQASVPGSLRLPPGTSEETEWPQEFRRKPQGASACGHGVAVESQVALIDRHPGLSQVFF